MASKSPPSLRHLHRQCWQPEQGQGPVIALDQDDEMGTLPGTMEESGSLLSLPGDQRPCPPHLQEMLESSNYQLALVRRSEGESQAAANSTASPPILLPFSWKELVARVCKFVGDSNTLAECEVARFEDVCVDFNKMEATRSSGEPVTLTTQQFKILRCFALNPNRVFSRVELLKEAWGYENYPSTRTVDNHILKLRQKLEKDPVRPVHFRTIHRVGYKFVP